MSKRLNRDDIDKFHDCSLYIPARIIFMGSEHGAQWEGDGESGTDSQMAERFIKNMLILESVSSDPITVIMDNVGGDEEHGMAIYDAIKCSKARVTIKVFGQACSMGSVILQAAWKRVMAPNAKQMIHYGSLELEGDAKNVQKIANNAAKNDKAMERIYLERIKEKNPRFKKEALHNMLIHDTYFTAKESVAMGLADSVISEPTKGKKR